MDTHLDLSLAASYTSRSQIARVVTEGGWRKICIVPAVAQAILPT